MAFFLFYLKRTRKRFFGTSSEKTLNNTQENNQTTRNYFNEGHEAFENHKYEKSKEIWEKLCLEARWQELYVI